jgi:hypothetical protein
VSNLFSITYSLQKALVVQPRLQALNVYAKVEANTTPLDDLPDSYFSQFSCIIMTNCSEVAASASPSLLPVLPHPSLKSQALRVNALCHQESHDIQFLLSDCYGAEGWFILDFGKQFTFQHDPPRHHVIESFSYPSLQEIWNTKWATLERKHFPISFTYLRSRIISEFRYLSYLLSLSLISLSNASLSYLSGNNTIAPHLQLIPLSSNPSLALSCSRITYLLSSSLFRTSKTTSVCRAGAR